MKTYITLAILICLACLSEAYATGISDTTNGFYLVIAGDRSDSIGVVTNEPIRFDDRLLWMPFCETGEVELTYAIPSYCVKVKMTDANGKEVPKTALGKKFGSKWDSAGNIWDSMQTIRNAYPTPFVISGSYKDNLGLGGARFLPKPSELFQIEKPGIYTLEIQMQMFRYVSTRDPVERSKTLFSFSPIKIKVEKPKEK